MRGMNSLRPEFLHVDLWYASLFLLKTRQITDFAAKVPRWTNSCYTEEGGKGDRNDLRIHVCEFQWARQRGSGCQQPLAYFQRTKNARAVNIMQAAKVRAPQLC